VIARKVLVSGLGQLGLPLAQGLQEAGHGVFGWDVSDGARDRARAEGIDIIQMPQGRGFPGWFDINFVIVPTHSREDGTFDPSLVCAAAQAAVAADIVAVVSTLLPAELLDVRAASRVGARTRPVVYCPEFVRLGFVQDDMKDPAMILVGSDDDDAGRKVGKVLQSLCDEHVPVLHLSLIEASLAKIGVNTMVTTKISFANMIGELCEALGADAARVCSAIGHDRRIGHAYFKPGGAYGGPCFPRDNKALSALARSLGLTADIAEATDRINERQPHLNTPVPGRGY
jgi:UDPglucose 6-dehydrogenase